ncbi:unnamed protein product [Linum trigynum]|uniref:Uncharacterized protein n=1 Tax=Linum trigynum TaxID=586398 RepID=A0AAV2DT01_9ROSI
MAQQEVFPSTYLRLKVLNRLRGAVVALYTCQSSKSKLEDSEASAREKTKEVLVLRSKQGTRRGLHVSFMVKIFPSSLRLYASFGALSMLRPDNHRPRRNSDVKSSEFLSTRTTSLL